MKKYTIINTCWLAILTLAFVVHTQYLESKVQEKVSTELDFRETELVNLYADRVMEMQSVIDKPDFIPRRPKTIKDIIDIIGEIAFSLDLE